MEGKPLIYSGLTINVICFSMVYTDGVHLIADTLEELHAFAREMGLKPEWFQQKRLQHYDLTTKRAVKRALSLGAVMVNSRKIVEIAKAAASQP